MDVMREGTVKGWLPRRLGKENQTNLGYNFKDCLPRYSALTAPCTEGSNFLPNSAIAITVLRLRCKRRMSSNMKYACIQAKIHMPTCETCLT